MKRLLPSLLSLALLLTLQACNSTNSGSSNTNDSGSQSDVPGDAQAGLPAGSESTPVASSRAGTSYRQDISSPVTGDTVVFQVFEPTQLEVGRSYPLILHGHGYGSSRLTTADDLTQRLLDAGYYVISIDQRGFGESGGQVRVMDPEYEGQNLIAVLDWAEDLEGLARRANGEMLVGSLGGSYGGMFQLLLHAVDPRHRLRVMTPDVAPHDLMYSLNPNNVVKSGWGLALAGVGEAGVALNPDPAAIPGVIQSTIERGSNRQDPVIPEILVEASLSNSFSESGFNFMRYHSFKYYCDGQSAGAQSFVFATPDQLTQAADLPPPADVLVTQGFLDTLFNFNDGLNNYECLKAIGGDVRLMTHQRGHILPVSPDLIGLEDPLDPFYAAITVPEFQDAGGSLSCGSMDLNEVYFAWFEEKLRGQSGAIDAVLHSGTDVCLSLAEGDAISVNSVKRGGEIFSIDASTPQFNSVLGTSGALLGNGAREALLATQSLLSVPAGGAVIAGVPILEVDIAGLSGQELSDCATPVVQLGCDPILFLALGHRSAEQTRWQALDGQITPIRGFGSHQIEMNGIAERLAEGDELALLFYGFHAQFPVTWSRDLLVPAMTVSGSIQLPLLSPAEILADGL